MEARSTDNPPTDGSIRRGGWSSHLRCTIDFSMKGFVMEQYPSFLAPIDPKKVEDSADDADRDRQAEERVEPAVYADLFSATEGKNVAR